MGLRIIYELGYFKAPRFATYTLLTFILSCWLAFAVCCGVVFAIIAGIAYGYNYCMAEFITLTRADVRVYVKRGQFLDKPDLTYSKRRSGDEEDLFPFNVSDYQQEVGLRDDSLSEKWMKDQDTRKYAEKLDKYSEEKTFVEPRPQVALTQGTIYYKFTTSKFRRMSYVPNRIISTTILQSGNSEIVMRQFENNPDNISDLMNVNDTDTLQYDYPIKDSRGNTNSEEEFFDESEVKVRPLAPDIRLRVEDNPTGRRTLKMRHWRTSDKPIIVDLSPDVDEEAVVYKVL